MMLFRTFKSDLMLISVSFALSLSDLSTSLSHSNSSHVKITSDLEFNFVSSVSSSLRLNSLSSQLYASFSLFFVAFDSESVIKKMMIISHDLSFDLAQNQMFLEFEKYIEKKLCSLILNIKINRNNISEMKKNVEDATINCRKMQVLRVCWNWIEFSSQQALEILTHVESLVSTLYSSAFNTQANLLRSLCFAIL